MLHANFVRRGVEVVQSVTLDSDKPGDGDQQPPSGNTAIFFLIFGLTLLIFSIAITLTVYTYGYVIPTLCMIETPSNQTYVPIAAVEPEDDSPPAYGDDGTPGRTDVEVNLIRTQPITSSLRATTRHLKARGGRKARFRGIVAFFVWGFSHGLVVSILAVIFRNPVGTIIASVLAQVVLANLHMTWIHIVISEPSEKPWYKRMPQPARRAWKRIAPAVALWAVASEITIVLPSLAAGTWGTLKRLDDPDFVPGTKDTYISAGQLFMAFTLRVLLFVLIQIPATVTMVRVAASMLPEEDETIVPFDRTFGGLTTPEIVGGQGKIGILEAWKSFTWECRRRLLKTVVKVAGLVTAMYLVFTVVVVLEAQLIVGEDFPEIMKGLHGISKGVHGHS